MLLHMNRKFTMGKIQVISCRSRLILIQELNVAMVIKEFNIRMLKSPLKPRPLQNTFNNLLSNIQKPLGIHHIRTILFSIP